MSKTIYVVEEECGVLDEYGSFISNVVHIVYGSPEEAAEMNGGEVTVDVYQRVRQVKVKITTHVSVTEEEI